jgi:hypothetical protein
LMMTRRSGVASSGIVAWATCAGGFALHSMSAATSPASSCPAVESTSRSHVREG